LSDTVLRVCDTVTEIRLTKDRWMRYTVLCFGLMTA